MKFVATCVFVSFLTAWAVDACAQPAGVDIAPFPGSQVYPMGDKSRVNGSALRMYYFMTKSPPEQVAEFYRSRWEEEGQIVSVNRTRRGGLGVGYVDLRSGQTRTVAIWRQDGFTFGFPAVIDGVPMPVASSPAVAGEVPIHPRAEGLATYESLERGAAFKTVNYSNPESLEKNESFYLREMGIRGYQLVRRQEGEGSERSVMLDFQKGKKKLSVTLVWVPRYMRCSVFAVTNALDGQHQEVQ